MRSRMWAPRGGAPSGGVWRLMACHSARLVRTNRKMAPTHANHLYVRRTKVLVLVYRGTKYVHVTSCKDKYFYLIVLLWVMLTFAASKKARMKHLPLIN